MSNQLLPPRTPSPFSHFSLEPCLILFSGKLSSDSDKFRNGIQGTGNLVPEA